MNSMVSYDCTGVFFPHCRCLWHPGVHRQRPGSARFLEGVGTSSDIQLTGGPAAFLQHSSTQGWWNGSLQVRWMMATCMAELWVHDSDSRKTTHCSFTYCDSRRTVMMATDPSRTLCTATDLKWKCDMCETLWCSCIAEVAVILSVMCE